MLREGGSRSPNIHGRQVGHLDTQMPPSLLLQTPKLSAGEPAKAKQGKELP